MGAAVVPLDRQIDRYGADASAPFVFACLLSVYLVLSSVAVSGSAIIAACLLWGAANHLALNIMVGRLTALSPDHRSAILGLYSAVTYVAMSVGTAAFKPVFERYEFSVTAAASAVFIVPALVGALRRRRFLRGKT